MDVSIRGIDSAIVRVIEEYAKENKQSRNEYIKNLLKYDAQKNIMNEINRFQDEKTNTILNALSIIIQRCDELEFELQKMFALLIYTTDMDQYEVDTILNKVVKKVGDSQ